MALSNLSRSIDGLVALVTGAGSGMGAATAKLFADQGARVAAIDINAEGLQEVVDEFRLLGKRRVHGCWTWLTPRRPKRLSKK